MCDYAFSDIECKIIKAQIERRAKYRREFMKMRTDPCKHSQQAGYVFEPALQHYVSMKTCQFDYFKPNAASALWAVCTVVIPMFTYGFILHKQRTEIEDQIRTGKLRYRDRWFKLR